MIRERAQIMSCKNNDKIKIEGSVSGKKRGKYGCLVTLVAMEHMK